LIGQGEAARRLTSWAFLGRLSYRPAFAMQIALREALRAGTAAEHFLLLEHPPVFTLGRNARPEDVVADPDWLRRHGVEVEETDRGGQVTFHGPGQLVGYPILDLQPDRKDIRRYVRDLQEVLILGLADFGIVGERKPGPENIGVWVEDRKIASLGVHVSRWRTTHGFALNVATDLSLFSGIVACGLPDVRMASIESLRGAAPALPDVAAVLARRFGEVFDRRMLEVDAAQVTASVAVPAGPGAAGLGTD
jgi:lipoyl(octanoyl) transferase